MNFHNWLGLHFFYNLGLPKNLWKKKRVPVEKLVSKEKYKPYTLGPEVEKVIIPGIGLIWAPRSLSITWKSICEEVKGKEIDYCMNYWIHFTRAIREPVSVYFWPYISLSFHGRVSHRVQGFDYGASCQICSVFFLPQ